MRLAPGTRLGLYEILAPLGAGGMGEVYRARDTRLGRDVAIKVLLGEVATDPELQARFEREARVVAALNHPNIVVLHSIEEQDGTVFLTMELVEGESLARAVVPGGLPFARLLELAIPLADALVAAHGKGVVHRDLKPGNVMLTPEGRLKVLDFGLAKRAPSDGVSDLSRDVTMGPPVSEVGAVLGTVPYMAPEQLLGEAVDTRTDLFALGIVLHELAVGRRPWGGATAIAISSAILRDPPPSLASLRPDLPDALDRIVARCLEKAPSDRFQTAGEVLKALKALRQVGAHDGAAGGDPPSPEAGRAGARAASPAAVSIAVLPFANRSGDAEDEYFSDGLADELVNMLVKVRGLHVAARASSFHFKGKNAPLADVGQALNVSTVLDGSVRKAGNRVRISVQLVKVADGFHLWSETYDRTLDDIFAVQDDIAQSVVSELCGTLLARAEDAPTSSDTRADLATIVKERTYDAESYDLYLRGRYLFGSTDDGPMRAQELFRRAIERSPRFALAYSGLGESYVVQSWLGSRDREVTVSQAKGALARALELDDRLCEARVLAGNIKLYFDWDWAGAEDEYRQAIGLNPGSDLAYREYGVFLSLMGRADEALEAAHKAQTLDPLSVNATHEFGYQLLTLGRLEEAAAEFRAAIDLNPTWIWGNIKLGMACSLMGDHERAAACVRRADELMGGAPGGPLTQAWLANITAQAGDPTRARSALARLEERGRTTYVDPVAIAWIHSALGEQDALIASLERGFDARSPLMPFLVQLRRFLWRVPGRDPRYEALIRRVGLPGA